MKRTTTSVPTDKADKVVKETAMQKFEAHTNEFGKFKRHNFYVGFLAPV